MPLVEIFQIKAQIFGSCLCYHHQFLCHCRRQQGHTCKALLFRGFPSENGRSGRADPTNVLCVRGRLQVESTARHRVIQLRKGVQHLHEGWIWSCAGGWSHAFCPAPLTVRDINIHYGQPNSLSAFFSWTCHAWPERRIIRRVPPKKASQIKSEQHWQSSGRRPMSPARLCPWCALIQGASLNSRQSATKNAALSHPPV